MGETYERPTLTPLGNVRVLEGADLDRLADRMFGVKRLLVPGTSDGKSLSDPGVDGMREETDAELRARLLAGMRAPRE
jgi:hypothetical protein